jgi:hypothetical protein
MPVDAESRNLVDSPNLIQKSIKAARIQKNTVYLSLSGVYPMLTRIGLVASWENGMDNPLFALRNGTARG